MKLLEHGKKNLLSFSAFSTSSPFVLLGNTDTQNKFGTLIYMISLQSVCMQGYVNIYTLDNESNQFDLIRNSHNPNTNALVAPFEANTIFNFPDGYYVDPMLKILCKSSKQESSYTATIYGYCLTEDD